MSISQWSPDAFAGSRVIVTGASSGIGQAIAFAYHAHGATVCMLARRLAVMEESIASTLNGGDGRAFAFQCDVTDEARLTEVIKQCAEKMGGIDILINNAGGIPLLRGGVPKDPEEVFGSQTFEGTFRLNVVSALVGTNAALPFLKESKGAVLNVSSIAAKHGSDNMPAYNCAKAGLDSLTRSQSLTYAHLGIRVNSLNPAVIETPIFTPFGLSTEQVQGMGKFHPVLRVGQPIECAAAAFYLTSKLAGFTTGVHLFVDGGASNTSSFWVPGGGSPLNAESSEAPAQ